MKKAFTLIEILIAVIVIGFLFAVTILNIPNISPDINKARFKKAYANLETSIYKLLDNETLYGSEDGFKDTTKIILKGIGETLGADGAQSKFRDALKWSLNIVKDEIDCELYDGMTSYRGCFMTDDGVVWGVGDTDFEKVGIINDSRLGNVTPIVIYTDWKKDDTVLENAFIVGIRFDGKIRILNTSSNICDTKPDYMQCKAKEFLKSNTIKNESRK